jgi:hypothetical protein
LNRIKCNENILHTHVDIHTHTHTHTTLNIRSLGFSHADRRVLIVLWRDAFLLSFCTDGQGECKRLSGSSMQQDVINYKRL